MKENTMIIDNIQIKNKKEIMKFVNKHKSSNHNFIENGSSTYDSYNLKNEKVLSSICKTFKKLTDNKFEILELWFNKYHKGGYVKPHDHSNGDIKNNCLTGVYYFKKPKNSGKLIINQKEIDVKEDDFVVFNIDDTHYTTKNLSNQNKIIFGVNMKNICCHSSYSFTVKRTQ